ncbi:MAG TPA: hypothetical protein VF039_05135 [Longimicrobiales bacterium]
MAISILLLESVRRDEPACAGRPGMLPACCSLGKIIAAPRSRERFSGRLHVNFGLRLADPALQTRTNTESTEGSPKRKKILREGSDNGCSVDVLLPTIRRTLAITITSSAGLPACGQARMG